MRSNQNLGMPSRRGLLAIGSSLTRAGFAAITLAALSGCGFRVRGAIEMPFQTIYLEGIEASPIGQDLNRILRLRTSGNGRVVDNADQAEIILKVLGEAREKEILGFSTTGNQRDYQLRLRFRYELLTNNRARIGEPVDLMLRRDVNTIESQLSAKQQEDVLLYREMQSDAVQQVLTRLRAARARAT